MAYRIHFLGTLLVSFTFAYADPNSSPTPRAVLDMNKLPQQGETLVWSPLFQATWDTMQSLHAGKLRKVDPPNHIITQLEQFQWNKDTVMPKGGFAVYAGKDTPEFTQQTAATIKKQFNLDLPTRTHPHNPQSYAYYGVLVSDLTFKKKFFRSKKQGLMFKDSSGSNHLVQFFGTAKRNSGGYQKSVRVLRNDPNVTSFVLSISTHIIDEKIIIYRPCKPESFAAAIQHILTARETPCAGEFMDPTYPYLVDGDIVKIPYLTANFRTDLTNLLKGSRYYEGDTLPWNTAWAYQVTHFKLTEKGARIRIQTGMDDAFGGTPEPRKFICDEPFFVFAWRDKAKHPYFAAWIDGQAALRKFGP